MKSFHVRIMWNVMGSGCNDWSGWYYAENPEHALRIAREAIAAKADVSEGFLSQFAQFEIRGKQE